MDNWVKPKGKTARLVVTNECVRNCTHCANKQKTPTKVIKDIYKDLMFYDEFVITGGEPMLFAEKLDDFLWELWNMAQRMVPPTKIYMYTAKVHDWKIIHKLLVRYLSGITVTLHSEDDAAPFFRLNRELMARGGWHGRSMRLHVFEGLDYNWAKLPIWNVKTVKWLKDCPVPDHEELCILENHWVN